MDRLDAMEAIYNLLEGDEYSFTPYQKNKLIGNLNAAFLSTPRKNMAEGTKAHEALGIPKFPQNGEEIIKALDEAKRHTHIIEIAYRRVLDRFIDDACEIAAQVDDTPGQRHTHSAAYPWHEP